MGLMGQEASLAVERQYMAAPFIGGLVHTIIGLTNCRQLILSRYLGSLDG